MAEVAPSPGVDGLENETPNQRQARLRREKRQKRTAEEGEERLAKIKALNGGVAPPAEVLGGPTLKTAPKAATVDDPEEVDIDTVSGTGTPRMRQTQARANHDPIAAAMLQMPPGQGDGAEEEDPMVRMMQQITSMMGGNAQNPNDPNQPPQLPAAFQAMLGGGTTGGGQQPPEPDSAYLWRIVHAIFAFSLAVYVAMTSTFIGSKLARSQSAYADSADYGLGPRLFWMFATAELMLQSGRYFLEKGQLQGNGILATIANSGFVPEPYAQYVRTLGRYVGIFQTIMADVMVIVFTFGALAWWQGQAAT